MMSEVLEPEVADQLVQLAGEVLQAAARLGQLVGDVGGLHGELVDVLHVALTIPSYERGVARLLRYDRHP